ncbi:MAG: CvpA family protein [Dethiobacter sp.]|nr:CvpA family protein [Dethiobacter sp.]
MISWLDVGLAVLVFYSAAAGWGRGLVRQFFDVAGVLAAYFVALNHSDFLLAWLGRYLPLTDWLPSWLDTPLPGGLVLGDVIASIISFVLLFLAVRLFFKALAGVLHGFFSLPLLGTFNGFGGLVLGSVKGIFLALVVVAILSLFPTPFWQRALEQSMAATSILYWLPIVYEQLAEVLLKVPVPTV